MDHLRCMLYIHGGAGYWGSINTHRCVLLSDGLAKPCLSPVLRRYTIWRYARKMRGRCFGMWCCSTGSHLTLLTRSSSYRSAVNYRVRLLQFALTERNDLTLSPTYNRKLPSSPGLALFMTASPPTSTLSILLPPRNIDLLIRRM